MFNKIFGFENSVEIIPFTLEDENNNNTEKTVE